MANYIFKSSHSRNFGKACGRTLTHIKKKKKNRAWRDCIVCLLHRHRCTRDAGLFSTVNRWHEATGAWLEVTGPESDPERVIGCVFVRVCVCAGVCVFAVRRAVLHLCTQLSCNCSTKTVVLHERTETISSCEAFCHPFFHTQVIRTHTLFPTHTHMQMNKVSQCGSPQGMRGVFSRGKLIWPTGASTTSSSLQLILLAHMSVQTSRSRTKISCWQTFSALAGSFLLTSCNFHSVRTECQRRPLALMLLTRRGKSCGSWKGALDIVLCRGLLYISILSRHR